MEDVRSEITCTLGSSSWLPQVLSNKAPLMLSPGPAVPDPLSLRQQLEWRSQEDSPKPWISDGIWLLGGGGAWPAPYHWQWARSACL